MHRAHPFRSLWPALAAAGLSAAAQPPCDSLHTASFTWQNTGNYNVMFTAEAPPSGSAVWSNDWGFAGESFQQTAWGPQVQYTFPGPGSYLACMLATVQHDQLGGCLSASCELITVPVDSLCTGLTAAFTIGVQGDSILFINQSQTPPGAAVHWDFGDGASSTGPAPAHTYAGTGPFQACLTVTSGPCAATVCNWIYLGPSPVACGVLLHPAMHIVQLDRAIAAFDHSITSGMEHGVRWDFGDGATATGSPALHIFEEGGTYDVCATVKLWGPLAADTCTDVTCGTVHLMVSAAVNEREAAGRLRAYPLPFSERLNVAGAPAGAHWELLDMLGRKLLEGTTSATGAVSISGETLPDGPFLFRLLTAYKVNSLRVLKAGGH